MKKLKSYIQKKRYLYTALALLLSIGIFISYFVVDTINEVITSFNLLEDFTTCTDNVNKTTLCTKEFLLTAYTDEAFHKSGKNELLERFDEKHALLNNRLLNVKKSISFNLKYDYIRINLEQYRNRFYKIVDLTREKGYKDQGLEGRMRNAIHEIEHFDFLTDQKSMLTLRRHEKDFLLRKDMKYKNNFDEELTRFVTSINKDPKLAAEQKNQILTLLSEYQKCFSRIVDIESQIGFSEKEGLRSELAVLHRSIDRNLAASQAQLNSSANNALANVKLIIWIITICMVLFIIFAASIYSFISKDIHRPLQELNKIADKISNGNLKVDFGLLNQSLFLSELSEKIEKIVDKFRHSMDLIEDVSNQKTFIKDTDFSKEDHVGQVITRISRQIEAMTIYQEERTWLNEANSKINLVLKDQESLVAFSDKITRTLVGILNANQAAMFLVENKNIATVLKMTSAYAYNRKKFIDTTLDPGEGLVGQCYLEKESAHYTEIPPSYLKITSGLGEALPRCLLIVPFIHNENVVAVMEIASFQTLKKHELEFLEKVGESIASAIYFIRTNEHTRKLLEMSKEQTEQLRAQEEEMRQNLEELSATQEAMMRSHLAVNAKEEAPVEQLKPRR